MENETYINFVEYLETKYYMKNVREKYIIWNIIIEYRGKNIMRKLLSQTLIKTKNKFFDFFMKLHLNFFVKKYPVQKNSEYS